MAGPKIDPEVLAHLEWLGFVRPTGLVVSAPALVRAGAILDRRDAEGQRLLRGCLVGGEESERVAERKTGYGAVAPDPEPCLPDFRAFAESVLGWNFSPKGYAGIDGSPVPSELEVPLLDYGETLRPDFAVRELEPKEGAPPWQLLVRVLEPSEDFDRVFRAGGGLEASAHGRMERLLRQTSVPAGVLFNGHGLRLVSAPRGESSGWLDFRVAEMVQTAGRPISTALRLLLGQSRLLSLPRAQRLVALLEDSRKFQNEVSERLAQQVLHALYELLRGFQAAHDTSKGELLRQPLADHPDEVYRALLSVILRLVFLLYAEERDMLPEDETFLRYYSLAGLYERLREDAGLFPDTMDQRFGAWAQLIVLFRMVHDGAEWGAMRLPKRHGVLFDPDRFKFLEGRPTNGLGEGRERIEPPGVPDGTIYRALEKLLVLDGERISYRALDVEQIGSVYETMMGFRLETATGRSVAIKPQSKHGAPTAVDLEALLLEPALKREKWLQDRADRQLTDTLKKVVAGSVTIEDLHAALQPVIDLAATPDLVPKGAMLLQPSEERRRSGSHYTPRALTEPIVRTTLEPILARLREVDGRPPLPAQILDLKVCDPAMGSGAFLVEACRQLGDALVEAWHAHGEVPAIPADEDEVVFARRQVAQRCLYGVDRNPVAVDLSKVSLWLVTLAKDHALTFVDHALRHGDSLVGLSRKQIEAFHWDPDAPQFQAGFETMRVREHVAKVSGLRRKIREADESVSDRELRDLWDEAQAELSRLRLFGDLILAAYFEGEKPKDQEEKRGEYSSSVVGGEAERYRGWLEDWRRAEQPLAPFHWELELPEVFERENPGFDAITGNPPFLGGTRIMSVLGGAYRRWLLTQIASGVKGIRGAADLCAYFYLRLFGLLRSSGCFGLVATNSIAQGDSRVVGLKRLLDSGATIYAALRSFEWPGLAATHVSVVWVSRNTVPRGPYRLDGRSVPHIGASLSESGEVEIDPTVLLANADIAFEGVKIAGIGFVISEEHAKQLLEASPEYRDVVFPYLIGDEVNTDPHQRPSRWVINFKDMALESGGRVFGQRVAADYPMALRLVEQRVRPQRMALKPNTAWNRALRTRWWQFGLWRPALAEALKGKTSAITISRVTAHHCFSVVPATLVFSDRLVVVASESWRSFAILSSRVHELWAHRPGSTTQGTTLNYLPTRAFATFPFPRAEHAQTGGDLDAVGAEYHSVRSSLMLQNSEGLTKTYNRFHDPDERDPGIVKLRDLHDAMDRAVLSAYGWSDIPTESEFLLDYEIDEEGGSKKKRYRYRWRDGVRDDVLARLLKLNADRAKAECSPVRRPTKKVEKKKTSAKGTPEGSGTEDLFS